VAEAAEIEQATQQMKAAGKSVRAVAVTHQTTRLPDFVSMSKWSGDMFMDEDKEWYAALGMREQDMSELQNADIKGAMKQAGQDASERGFVQNLDGEGMLLGGVVVLDSKGGVVFEHRECRWSDAVSTADLVAACTQHCKL
jgi:hypothetical protein